MSFVARTGCRMLVALPLTAGAALAQIARPPCPAGPVTDLRVSRDDAAGDLLFTWGDLPCQLQLERRLDVRFPPAATDVLHEPLADGAAPRPLRDSPPAANLVAYRLAEFDGGWPFWDACWRSDLQSGIFTELRNDDGVPSVVGNGLGAGDIESALFIAPAPMRLTRLRIVFAWFGTPSPIEVHIHGDFGNRQPNESVDLIPPIVLQPADMVNQGWTDIDLTPYAVDVHPNDLFWVSAVHQGAEPYVALDGASGGTPHLAVKYQGTWLDWGTNNDHVIRVEGERFCEVVRPIFGDRTAGSGLETQRGWKVGWADVDGDLHDDLLLNGVELFLNDRTAGFVEATAAAGLTPYLGMGGFGILADLDNDGDLDLYLSATYVFQHGRLYRQESDATFTDVSYEAGIYRDETIGHAWADHDRDGDQDLVLTHWDGGGTVHLYENMEGAARNWVAVRLRGEGCATPGGCNCTGIGAKVTLVAGGESQVLEVQAGRGHYVNQSSQSIEFGLGGAMAIDELCVRWPCGAEETYVGALPNRFTVITEGSPSVTFEWGIAPRIPEVAR